MPWKVYKVGRQWCVHKLTSRGNKGKKVACHDSETKAKRQLRALNASEFGERKNNNER